MSASRNHSHSRAVSSLPRAMTAGLCGLMPRPGSFIALMMAAHVALISTGLLIYGVAASLCACLAVVSDLLCERRSRAARELSE